jgi:hypothetical protein
MNFKISAALALVLVLSACGGKDKTTAGSAVTATPAPAPVLDFKSIAGVIDSTDAQNVCPYVELAGFYKIGSSECSLGGKKVELDTLLTPTSYVISELGESTGSVEAHFTGDGIDLFPFTLDFPRIQTSVNSKKQGVQCGADSEKNVLKLYQSCIGTNVNGPCFFSIVKKENKLFAVTSRIRNGLQYWCKANLRKMEQPQ